MMVILNPRAVRFGGVVWEPVRSVVIDREGARVVTGLGDAGPYATLVDVPEQQVRATVVMEVVREFSAGPVPGELGVLSVAVSPASSEGGRRRVTATAVVVGVRHEVSQKNGALRTVELVLVSPDGAADPVLIGEAAAD